MSNEQENPLVSVVIPTYKRPDMLGRAIDSVLNQTYDNIEIIVVDDNDEDSEHRKETEDFMKKYADVDNLVYLKHKKNKGGSAARNTGIRNSSGEFISFLDDDDEFLPNKINQQLGKLLKMDNEYGAISCGYVEINNGDKKITQKLPEGNLKLEILQMKVSLKGGSTLLFRKEIFDNIGFFDDEFIRHQDYEFLVRFFRFYKMTTINLVLSKIYTDNNENKLAPHKLIKVKEMYLDKFQADICNFGNKKSNKIYQIHWLEVSLLFLENKNLKMSYKYYKKAKKFRSIKNKTKLKFLIKLVDYFFNIDIFSKLNNVYRKL